MGVGKILGWDYWADRDIGGAHERRHVFTFQQPVELARNHFFLVNQHHQPKSESYRIFPTPNPAFQPTK